MTAERRTGPGTSLRDLARARPGRRHRASSWDRTGGNDDRFHVLPGQTTTLLDVDGAGIITHIWVTTQGDEEHHLRKAVLRIYWDGEQTPSVEVPVGDFFGMGHAITRPFESAALTMSAQDGKSFNCFFAMPFAHGARVTVTSDCATEELLFYYYIDYEAHERLDDDLLRFHAQWRRQNPCDGLPAEAAAELSNDDFEFGGKNIGGEGNYVILEATGRGHYVGCNLNVTNLRQTAQWNWYGEGDDMIWVDQDRGDWPPRLHGTGTEDYFNTAWCPAEVVSAPYHGMPLPGGPNWSGQISLYRLHIEDPVLFERDIRVTIEHGHNNQRSDDYSSTAYWYQTEPHAPFPPLPHVSDRLPATPPSLPD
jgi:Protein of unknown function (DUF2961)